MSHYIVPNFNKVSEVGQVMRTTSPGRFTVFLIDDDQGRLDTLNNLLRAVGYETKAYTAPQPFLDEHDPAVHGCTLLDLSMPGLNGLDVQQELVRRGIDRPIIFLTGSDSVLARVEAFKAGAIDFLIKPAKEAELLNAIRTAVKRDSERLHSYAVAKRVGTLTPRERQVLALVARGVSNKNIAAALGVREKSIEVNRSRAMKKLGAKNVSGLVRMTSKGC
jgi:FixJ family two-component response regulator